MMLFLTVQHYQVDNAYLSCRVLELLLQHDASLSIRDHAGYCAVHYAAFKGHRLALETVILMPFPINVSLYICYIALFI